MKKQIVNLSAKCVLCTDTSSKKHDANGNPVSYYCLEFDFGDGNLIRCFDKDLIARVQALALSILIKKGG
jgi:hypothetical protein